MGKPAYDTVIAERKAILAIVEPEKGESTADAVARALAEKDAELDRMKGQLKLMAEAELKRAEAEEDRQSRDAVAVVADIARQQSEQLSGGPLAGLPADYAYYPKPGEQYRAPEPPPGTLTASQGDLGAAYVQWFLTTHGPDKTREKYGTGGTAGSRIHLLPPDVQAALK